MIDVVLTISGSWHHELSYDRFSLSGMMSHISSTDPEDYIFGDIGRMVGYAFQVTGYEQGVKRMAVTLHGVDHGEIGRFEDLSIHVIHHVVAFENRARQFRIYCDAGDDKTEVDSHWLLHRE